MSAVLEAREPSARYLEAVRPALIRRFDLIATAPGGVARLRELILTLAVQGKLVEQDPSDEPADRLIARVHAARSKLVASGRIGKQKPAEPVNEDETAFSLPQGWAWSRVGDLASPQAGFAFKSTGFNEVGQGLPLIRIRDVGSAEEPTTYFSGEFRPEFVVEKGEWLISMDGEFRVRQWHATTALLNQRVTRLVFVANELHAAFIATALQRELTALQGTKAYTTVDHLSGKQIAEAVIALPPATEQARIVARVDELMRLCDALEAKGRLEAEQHARLLGVLLGTLTDSSTPEELAANWQRVAAQFDLLLDRPEAVDALEQTVLQLAVRGLLVPQDPSDEPAMALVARIRVEKDQLIASGKIRRDKPIPAVNPDSAPFALPQGWAWARFPELGEFGRGKSKHRPRNDPALFSPPIYPLVQTGEVARAKGTVLEYHSKYSDVGLAQSRLWPAGTLCITIAANIADAAILGFDACFPDSVVGFVPAACLGGTTYFHVFLETAKTDLVKFAPATAQKNINLEVLESLLVPVPPKRELERIVARVTELRRLCADLRQRLTAGQTIQSHLADALVESALP